ncbi:Imm26 family immunity protein [Pseudoalteromonas luteoviolacea]|uniref:Immunity protein 26 n=1 Tax=Pseudoalteromonas luteoviolacea S4060-1 TaxID=1365257 RepID=A0A161Y2A7_9GAMM|nr:Imm26 family immunity protein [Pseudoalteromonas luteoviolacea]KZN60871.1 hypothetical protein N478_26045 [Pseudoalteromonas luteoviolacea S4060-1]
MKRVKFKIGDIVKVPVVDNLFVYGRILNDASIEIYNKVFDELVDVNELKGLGVLFDCGIFSTAIKNGEWEIIGHIPFENEEDSWPKPKFIQDIINREKFCIYYKGERVQASKDEIINMDEQAMYKPEQLVERIKQSHLFE